VVLVWTLSWVEDNLVGEMFYVQKFIFLSLFPTAIVVLTSLLASVINCLFRNLSKQGAK